MDCSTRIFRLPVRVGLDFTPANPRWELTAVVQEPFSFSELRQTDAWRGHALQSYVSGGYLYSEAQVSVGRYHLRLPVPDSYGRAFGDQLSLLLPGERVAPAALAAAVLLFLGKVGFHRLDREWVRCAEATPAGGHAELGGFEGRLACGDGPDAADGRVGLAAFRPA